MSDLISRNDAIEAIDFEKVYMTAYLGYVNEGNPLKQYNKGIDDAIKAINKLPSAGTERTGEWIPASECLPAEEDEVLVTVLFDGYKDGIKPTTYVEVAHQINGEWSAYSDEYKVERSRHHVIAWMPLPEPYRAEMLK